MNRHATYVHQPMTTGRFAGLWSAACRGCGWRGDRFSSEREANDAATDHEVAAADDMEVRR